MDDNNRQHHHCSDLPVAQLFGKIDVKYMRHNVDQLRGIAQRGADGVGRVVMLHV